MKRIFFISILAITFLGTTCVKENENCHKTITFINASDENIYVIGDTYYPDTMYFGHSSSPKENETTQKVLANSISNKPLQSRDCWEIYFTTDGPLQIDTLMVYVFDADIVDSLPWSEVVHNYMVLKRYDISLKDLNTMNWSITYP